MVRKIWKASHGEGDEGKAEARAQSHEDGDSEQPTRGGGRSEPVERRGSEAATLPQALQSGIVHCPPTPQGSRQEGEAPGIESTPPIAQGDRWTRNTLRTRGHEALNNREQNKNKEKKIRVSPCSDSRIEPHTGGRWDGEETKRQGGPGPLLL